MPPKPQSESLKTGPAFWPSPVALSFLLCLAYWSYLLFTAQPVFQTDPVIYRKLGLLLYNGGWQQYFRLGPLQEPGYPLLLSLAMHIEDATGISFVAAQKLFQVLLLFLADLLLWALLKQMKVDRRLIAAAVLYFGLSPAIVNSTFSFFSEIVIYPAVLGMVISAAHAWQHLPAGNHSRIMLWGGLLGLCGLWAVFVKGIFELIVPLFLLPFFVFLFYAVRRGKSRRAVSALVLFCAFGLTFYGPLTGYKSLNKKYNGNFALTNRGPWALYGNITRRSEPLSPERLLTALAFIPGERFCHSVCGAQRCNFWSYLQSDGYAFELLHAFEDLEFSSQDADQLFTLAAARKFLEAPLQNVLLMGIETLKMCFWESTRVGYVAYPGWLTGLFASTFLNNILKIMTAGMTFAAMVYVLGFLWRNRALLAAAPGAGDQAYVFLFFSVFMLACYLAAFSFFYFLIRYAFPVVSLFLASMAFSAQRIIDKRTRP